MSAAADFPDRNPSAEARILLVDDDAEVRISLGRALASEGYGVVTAADGQEALEKFYEGYIQLVLLDLNLLATNGWDVFERMTAVSPFLPIVIITARPHQYELAAAAGASAIMEKPLCLPLLIESIERLIHEPVEKRVRRIIGNRPLLLTSPA